jgi:hypothetical protein
MHEGFGTGQGFTHQTGHALPHGSVEALNGVGFPGFLRDSAVRLCWDHSFPDGLWVRLACRLCTVDQLRWALGGHGIRAGGQAGHHNGHAPRETDGHGTAEPVAREARTPQRVEALALGRRKALIYGISRALAAPYGPGGMRLPMAGRAMGLGLVRSPGWTRVSDDHGCRWSPSCSRCF